MKKKLLSRSGETLIESLAAILVAVLVFLFLTTAVVTAAKVNKKVSEYDLSFQYSRAKNPTTDTLTISGDAETYTAQVERYTDNQYTFYVLQKGVTP